MNGQRLCRPGVALTARWAASLGVVCACLWGGTAAADELESQTATDAAPAAPSNDEEAQARLFFEAAKLAYDAEQYAQAARLFEQVYELSPHPFMLINLASAYRHLDDPTHEAEALQRYLQSAGSEADPAYVQRFEVLIDELAAKLPRRDRRKLLRLEASVLEELPPMPRQTSDESEEPGSGAAAKRHPPPSLWREYRAAWLTLGGTLALSGSALSLWLSTRATYDSVMRQCQSDEGCATRAVDDVASRTRAIRTLATLSLLSATATGALFAWPIRHESRDRAMRSAPQRMRARLVWRAGSLALQGDWK